MSPEKVKRFALWARREQHPVRVERTDGAHAAEGFVVECSSGVLTVESRATLELLTIPLDKVGWIGLPEGYP